MSTVLIIGAGLSGLCCALELERNQIPYQIYEASDGIGGRVRTDEVNGFLLDRGFQVLLEAYPECQRILDYRQLNLKRFEPGAVVWYGGKLRPLYDPRRKPAALPGALVSPLASFGDKLRMGRYILGLERQGLDQILSQPETTTATALDSHGFSPALRDRFLTPFLAGIFLESELNTSSRKFDFVMRMFSDGAAWVPARGMGQIPAQIASRLHPGSIRLNCPVRSATQNTVVLENGNQISGRAVVIATAHQFARKLRPQIPDIPSNRVSCLYFMAPEPPFRGPTLILNGEGASDGPVNNLAVMTEVSAAYGPAGTSLISVSVVGPSSTANLEPLVRMQLTKWFGDQVSGWFHLKTYEIEHALPSQAPHAGGLTRRSPRLSDGTYICGDYCDSASINGAMLSGRRAAEAIMADLN